MVMGRPIRCAMKSYHISLKNQTALSVGAKSTLGTAVFESPQRGSGFSGRSGSEAVRGPALALLCK